ncbi:MAG TPA: hypothetical protein VFV58_36840 [Blastocatellia bacterium]|jgi:hypothetical protein|nr:hypothetical protein [Blastocatellia bacterium]
MSVSKSEERHIISRDEIHYPLAPNEQETNENNLAPMEGPQ